MASDGRNYPENPALIIAFQVTRKRGREGLSAFQKGGTKKPCPENPID
jgi:hypothetical protein